MKRDDIIKSLEKVVGGTTLTCVECSCVGSIALIDEIIADYKEEVRGNIRRMFRDKAYYKERGGWGNFTKEENKYYLEKALAEIENQGYEFDSVDFFDELNGVLFLKVTAKQPQKIA